MYLYYLYNMTRGEFHMLYIVCCNCIKDEVMNLRICSHKNLSKYQGAYSINY